MNSSTSNPTLRLYHDLADWYPLLTPVGDYAEEAAFYRRLFEAHCKQPPRTLLDLGSGGGHNAAHLKSTLICTLVDIAPAILSISCRLNPECEHVQGDMRSIRFDRVYDCVLIHDAISYMASREDLGKAIGTAFAHSTPGGMAMFQPDFVSETFQPGTETGGSDDGGRGLRYLEWRWIPGSGADLYVTDMAYLLRDENGAVEVAHDRHIMGAIPARHLAEADRGGRIRAACSPLRAQLVQPHRARNIYLQKHYDPATGRTPRSVLMATRAMIVTIMPVVAGRCWRSHRFWFPFLFFNCLGSFGRFGRQRFRIFGLSASRAKPCG